MAIRVQKGPDGGVEAAMQAFRERARRFKDETPVGGAKDVRPQIYEPLPVYIFSYADALRPEESLQQVSPTEWRYPVTRASKRRMVHMQADSNGHPEFLSLSQGMMVDNILDAAVAAERLFSTAGEAFAPGIISIPSLRLNVIWMRGEDKSYFAPIVSTQTKDEDEDEDKDAPKLSFVDHLEPLIKLARSSLPGKRMIPDLPETDSHVEA